MAAGVSSVAPAPKGKPDAVYDVRLTTPHRETLCLLVGVLHRKRFGGRENGAHGEHTLGWRRRIFAVPN